MIMKILDVYSRTIKQLTIHTKIGLNNVISSSLGLPAITINILTCLLHSHRNTKFAD